jgi:hypothetical protein
LLLRKAKKASLLVTYISIARETNWVKEDNLNVERPTGALEIHDDAANIPQSRAVAKGASVFQKIAAMLYSEIIADTDKLLERGADLTVLRDLKGQSRTVEK